MFLPEMGSSLPVVDESFGPVTPVYARSQIQGIERKWEIQEKSGNIDSVKEL